MRERTYFSYWWIRYTFTILHRKFWNIGDVLYETAKYTLPRKIIIMSTTFGKWISHMIKWMIGTHGSWNNKILGAVLELPAKQTANSTVVGLLHTDFLSAPSLSPSLKLHCNDSYFHSKWPIFHTWPNWLK